MLHGVLLGVAARVREQPPRPSQPITVEIIGVKPPPPAPASPQAASIGPRTLARKGRPGRMAAAPAASGPATDGVPVEAAPANGEPIDLGSAGLVAGNGSIAVGNVAPPGPSVPAEPEGDDWACAWPEEPGLSALRDVPVTVRVDVGTDGRALSARVVGEAAPPFARAAVACALAARYRPARDPDGRPARGSTRAFVVRFVR